VTDPLVSVLVLSYNQADFLAAAIESAVAQTWRNLEVIVVDNGSTDASPAVLDGFEHDSRVTIIRHSENGPITARMNEAVRMARGDWVSFLFSDDLYRPGMVEHQLRAALAAEPSVGVVYCPTIVEDVRTGATSVSPSIAVSGWIFEDLMRRPLDGPVQMIAALIDRRAMLAHPFHEELFVEGESIFFRLALYERFLYVDEPLVVSRDHASNMGKAIIRNRDWVLRVHDRLRAEPGLQPKWLPLVNRHQAINLRSFAWQGARLGADRGWVRNCLRRAAAQDPRSLSHPHALGATALVMAPLSVAKLANRLGDRLAPDHNRRIVEHYDGHTRDR